MLVFTVIPTKSEKLLEGCKTRLLFVCVMQRSSYFLRLRCFFISSIKFKKANFMFSWRVGFL
jgi:hypothetical protein